MVVWIESGEQAGSGWSAEGAGRIGSVKSYTIASKLVDMWRFRDRRSIAGKRMGGLLVSQKKKDIWCLFHYEVEPKRNRMRLGFALS